MFAVVLVSIGKNVIPHILLQGYLITQEGDNILLGGELSYPPFLLLTKMTTCLRDPGLPDGTILGTV